MAENESVYNRVLAECNQSTINMSKCKGKLAQCYIINHEPYEEKVARNSNIKP
jgi:hypothetical protein